MNFLPIVERELRVGARKRETYWMRSGVALCALAVALCVVVVHDPARFRMPLGQALLLFITLPALVLAMMAGLFLTSTAVAEERQQGTLGLLFLTNLRGHDVVLGKFAAYSYHAFLGLAALLPVLCLPMLVGGLMFAQVARTGLALGVVLLFSLSLGMLVSILSRHSRQALGGTLLILLFFYGVLPAVWLTDQFLRSPARADFLLWVSPVHTWSAAMGMGPVVQEYGNAIRVMGGLSVLALGVASLCLKSAWTRSEAAHANRTPPRSSARTRWPGRFSRGRSLPVFGASLYEWLALREGKPGRYFFLVFFTLLPFIVGLLLASIQPNLGPQAFIGVMFITFGLHQVYKLLLGLESSRRFAEDRQNGAIELLLVTPLEPHEMLRGQRRALKRRFRKPALTLVFLGIGLFFWVLVFREPLSIGPTEYGLFGFCFLGSLVLLWTDSVALAWSGMLAGVVRGKLSPAMFDSYFKVMVPPWAAFLLLFFTLAPRPNSTPEQVFLPWMLFSFVYSLSLAARARARLVHLRRLVTGASATPLIRPPPPGLRPLLHQPARV